MKKKVVDAIERVIKANEADQQELTAVAVTQEGKTPPAIAGNSAALYTLWFGLDYGSILTAYALYRTVEELGKTPYLLAKPDALWSDHYADRENIAGKFIYAHCAVLPGQVPENIHTHIVGSDVVWDCRIINDAVKAYFYLNEVTGKDDIRVALGTSFGGQYQMDVNKRNDDSVLFHKFDGISVKSFEDSQFLSDYYYIQPEIVLDPVFLCDKNAYRVCAGQSVAKKVEKEEHFIFTYIKNGNERKRSLLLKGNAVLLESFQAPLRNFIDINRYPESRAALGLEPAYHILVEDWLHYLIHSDFVITDDYYGMCFAILFEKPFVVVCDRGIQNKSDFCTLLEQLDLTERIVYTDEDYKTKLYLFRKPIRYNIVNAKLEKLRSDSRDWFKAQMSSQNDHA